MKKARKEGMEGVDSLLSHTVKGGGAREKPGEGNRHTVKAEGKVRTEGVERV